MTRAERRAAQARAVRTALAHPLDPARRAALRHVDKVIARRVVSAEDLVTGGCRLNRRKVRFLTAVADCSAVDHRVGFVAACTLDITGN